MRKIVKISPCLSRLYTACRSKLASFFLRHIVYYWTYMTAWLVDEWQDWTGRRVVDNMTAVVQISAGRWRRTTIIGLPTKTAFCNNHIQCKQCKARHDTLRIVYRYSLDVVDSPWGFYGPAILILAGFGPVQSRLIILLTTQAWKQTLPPSDRTPYYIYVSECL